MESLKIYEESRKELAKVARSFASESIAIDVSKLDEHSKGEIITALQKVISNRIREIDATYLGVQNN